MKIETLPLASVVPDPANVRLHDDRNLDAIRGSLARFGQQKPIVVDSAGVIRAGNGTYMAAKALGWETIDVVRTGLEGLDATAFAIADNRTSDLSTFDDASLAKLLAELRAEDALDGLGFDESEIDELLAGLDLEGGGLVEDPGPQEPPETPITRTGDLWLLGDHRLLCGDSTKPEDVERLMAGKRAHLLASDPPYLVNYTASNHPPSSYNRPETANKDWDAYQDPASSIAFFKGYLELGLKHSVEDVAIYQWHATRRQVLVEQAWTELGLLVHQTVIWVKSRAVLTRSMLMWRHEPCFFGWVQGNMPPKDRRPPPNETTVWEVDQVGQQDGIHPCLHPDALVWTEAGYRPISSVHVGERVLSADGRFHEVSHVSAHPYTSKDLVCIVAKGGNVPTLASDNHPFLIWRPKRNPRQIVGGEVLWLRADEIRVGDYTLTPILAEVGDDPYPERDAEYWFLFGLYLAQGSLQGAGHGGQNRYPTFSLHKKRQDIVRRIRARWSKVGEYDPNDYGAGPSQGLTVMAFDPEAGAEFEALGGRGAGAKHLAPAIFRLPRDKRMAVLEGWLNGDGCRVHNRDYWQGKTVSTDLVHLPEISGSSEPETGGETIPF